MSAPVDPRVVEYVAREALSRYGPIEPGRAAKVRRNLRRNLALSVATEEIEALLRHYKELYRSGASLLRNHLRPPAGKLCDPGDVDFEGLVSALSAENPGDDRALLSLVANWVIYYEYLR